MGLQGHRHAEGSSEQWQLCSQNKPPLCLMATLPPGESPPALLRAWIYRVASGSGAVGWAAEATVTRSQASAKMLSS